MKRIICWFRGHDWYRNAKMPYSYRACYRCGRVEHF